MEETIHIRELRTSRMHPDHIKVEVSGKVMPEELVSIMAMLRRAARIRKQEGAAPLSYEIVKSPRPQ
ncbi:hypothetical protein [Pseudoflavonifractor hominis]|uniref:Uncharacterized protein n=1 Tax=Pseudoflavonifractor hominis TaxID=2763059 RepID=A0ABR7HUQ1_9FIRM|nr:hypothetical protein [Pseudoflavonifractor hominis]MBC5731141.1 hypothetical protein [Pseudoflavonifractor hominis]